MEVTAPPRDLSYSERHAEVYKKLTTEKLSPFYKKTFKDVFLYAVAYGFRHLAPEPLERPQPNIPLSVFNKEERWIIKAIAIHTEGKLEVLADQRKVYEIAEAYANAAIETIHAEVLGGKPGEPYKRMMQDIVDEFEQINTSIATA